VWHVDDGWAGAGWITRTQDISQEEDAKFRRVPAADDDGSPATSGDHDPNHSLAASRKCDAGGPFVSNPPSAVRDKEADADEGEQGLNEGI
jgi:hypothetical protein